MSERTWFSTLTMRPERRMWVLSAARAEADRQGYDFDALDDQKRFRGLCKQVSRELTLYVKRVRKNSGARFRFLAVFEKHESGDPHIHMLVHERDPAYPVRERVLSAAWTWGFSKHRLVERDSRAANYVCKYLTKSADVRVRASLRYGSLSDEEREGTTLVRNDGEVRVEEETYKRILSFITDGEKRSEG